MDEKTALLEQAERCRRAAHAAGDHQAAATRLMDDAKEYEERAASLPISSPPLQEALSQETTANTLVRRDQFTITSQGIIHKPTNAAFTPHPGDPHSATIHFGQLGNMLPNGHSYSLDEVERIMRELWAEYVARNAELFKHRSLERS